MNEKPNWTLIDKCKVWPVLGVTECNSCPRLINCWGTNSQLPEPKLSPDEQTKWEKFLGVIK